MYAPPGLQTVDQANRAYDRSISDVAVQGSYRRQAQEHCDHE